MLLRATRWVLGTLVFAASFVQGIPSATAAPCTNPRWIFVREDSSTTRWGVRGKIWSEWHTRETSCEGRVFTTIHHSDCANVTCWTHVEIGITESASDPLVIFTEKQKSGETKFYEEWALSNVNDWVIFRIRGFSKPNGTVDYHMEYNRLDGWGWVDTRTYNVGWGTAYPMGETEKLGQDTTMWSKHRNLKYLTSAGTEIDWGGMRCAYDTAPGWKWSPISGSNNDYDVVNTAADC